MSEFDDAIALTPLEHGRHAGRLDDQWRIGEGINGGLLMALLGAGLRAELNTDGAHPDPLAMSAYFLSASVPGEVRVDTTVLRSGRSMSTAQASLIQIEGEREVERVRALATYGDLTSRAEPVLRAADRPTIPPPDACLSADDAPDFLSHSTLLQRMDLHLDPATAEWVMGKPSHQGVMDGWVRLRDGREPDAISLLWALDALPPVAFDLGLFGWTPTLELTAHLRAHPAPGWLQVRLTTANVAGGLMEEDATVWDSTGRLVAISRQLCGWRTPRATC